MTRLDAGPPEASAPTACEGPEALLLEAREVPLGGVRGMEVHRSLPQSALPMVGAWCFLDRFGPQTARMRVEPHPHIGLQTVTWPFVGEVRHRDVLGSDVIVRRGALNLMTSGGATATVVVGTFGGATSPATMYTPIAGVEVHLPAGASVTLPLEPAWEYALVGVGGEPAVQTDAEASIDLADQSLLYLGLGREAIEVTAERDATVFVLGGEPFESDIVTWWSFVARTHEEIVDARDAWEAEGVPGAAQPRFGHVVDHGDERIPAPPLPAVRLTPRRRRD